MSADLEISRKSLKEFQAALRTYEKATGKAAVDVVNRQMKNWIIQTFQRVKRGRGIPVKFDPNRRTKAGRPTKASRMLYATLTKLGKSKKGQGIQEAAEAIYENRRKASGYLKASLIPALKLFGGARRARNFKGLDDNPGFRARTGSLTAAFRSLAGDSTSTNSHLAPAARQGLEATTEDMLRYAQRRFQKEAKKVKPR